MSDFYKARLAATYTPADGQEVALIRHNHLLAEPPSLEWSLQTASYEYIAHTWAGDLPSGNARLTLAAQPLLRANTRAALERKLRRLELALNLNREGSLLLEEAFSQGVPTLHTYWHAVIETANASPLPLDQAPPIPGAWGKLELSIILTHPSQEPPQQTTTEETSSEEETTTEDTTEEETSSQGEPVPLYATGWLRFANGRPDDDIGLYINGTHICTDCEGGGTGQQWADAINAANCGVTATPHPHEPDVNVAQVDLTATTPGEDGQLTLELRDNLYYDPAYHNMHDFLSGPTLSL